MGEKKIYELQELPLALQRVTPTDAEVATYRSRVASRFGALAPIRFKFNFVREQRAAEAGGK